MLELSLSQGVEKHSVELCRGVALLGRVIADKLIRDRADTLSVTSPNRIREAKLEAIVPAATVHSVGAEATPDRQEAGSRQRLINLEE